MVTLKLRQPCAEIRIGIIPRAEWEGEMLEYESCFSLHIDGALVDQRKKTETYARKNPHCIEVGVEYRNLLDQKGVDLKNCRIIDGERTRSADGHPIIPCYCAVGRDFELFSSSLRRGSQNEGWSRKIASSE